ncbi:uncharacterized protein CLUP02_06077 [Colletotrichum lupini]|uniref:Uncharacterized protein n=1 Tax=Colletotrichum lupini TaxID=145971 RepID=A0A9Q8SNF1_9PEZI|nr:uncharacterized protein CLUP02_06077 [Colletotrichum lupini]UQC80594.1 hypothetical protein CLUP02_06077 [Colletotrichum lupini]
MPICASASVKTLRGGRPARSAMQPEITFGVARTVISTERGYRDFSTSSNIVAGRLTPRKTDQISFLEKFNSALYPCSNRFAGPIAHSETRLSLWGLKSISLQPGNRLLTLESKIREGASLQDSSTQGNRRTQRGLQTWLPPPWSIPGWGAPGAPIKAIYLAASLTGANTYWKFRRGMSLSSGSHAIITVFELPLYFSRLSRVASWAEIDSKTYRNADHDPLRSSVATPVFVRDTLRIKPNDELAPARPVERFAIICIKSLHEHMSSLWSIMPYRALSPPILLHPSFDGGLYTKCAAMIVFEKNPTIAQSGTTSAYLKPPDMWASRPRTTPVVQEKRFPVPGASRPALNLSLISAQMSQSEPRSFCQSKMSFSFSASGGGIHFGCVRSFPAVEKDSTDMRFRQVESALQIDDLLLKRASDYVALDDRIPRPRREASFGVIRRSLNWYNLRHYECIRGARSQIRSFVMMESTSSCILIASDAVRQVRLMQYLSNVKRLYQLGQDLA